MIPFSVLDVAPIGVGKTATDALRNSLELAQLAERLNFQRFWLAEHHNMPGIASAATAVVIAHIAGGTRTIRVGSGGVMLPNHAPLVIAEQFGTLAALHPGRIDLGLGRAPGTDGATMRALRRDMHSADQFPQDVQELQAYLSRDAAEHTVRAFPGAGTEVPIWLLGSSLFSAQLAAMMGLPFAFAAHFAPAELWRAIEIYRQRFKPSAQWPKPHVMVAVNTVAAATDAEARYHFTSQQQTYANLRRGKLGAFPAPIDDIETFWSPQEKAMVEHSLACSFVGSPQTVAAGLREFIAAAQPDELMVNSHIYHQDARLRSLEIIAEVRDSLA